jgi:hypothetical protein
VEHVMSLNLSIIDQRVGKLAEDHHDALGGGDEDRLRSKAFVLLVASTVLDIPIAEALDLLTDGGHDAAMDALHVGDVLDGEFVVTLFQGKYKRRQDGEATFPANEIGKLIHTVAALFDPGKPFDARPDVLVRVEELRSLVRDGHLPVVRVILCNNGQRWGKDGQALIDASGLPPEQVQWDHVNHDTLVSLLQRPTAVDDQLQLVGEAVIEEFDFCRVLVGKTRVTELARLFERHGDRLLERNIRRYLGLRSNRVNKGIAETLRSRKKRKNFYFFNNGITLTCSKFRHNALQGGDYLAKLETLQVINGGQTCHTIQRTLAQLPDEDFSQTFVLVRVYELDDSERELVPAITYATNSQNPVELRDLRANDEVQVKLETGLLNLGYVYARKREETQSPDAITPARAAEAVLAVWRRQPHVARFHQNQLFGNLYERIFDESLTPAQVVVAMRILERTERMCRQANLAKAPRFLPYAAHFLAMLVGEELLERLEAQVSHRNLDQTLKLFDEHFDTMYERAVLKLRVVFGLCGIDESTVSLQRLSATFRRGDLLDTLDHIQERALAMEAEVFSRSTFLAGQLASEMRTVMNDEQIVQFLIKSLKAAFSEELSAAERFRILKLGERFVVKLQGAAIPTKQETLLSSWIRQLYPDKVAPYPNLLGEKP